MQAKEYRVVCSRPKFGGDVIVDIVPSRGVIHDQIFFTRRWLHKQQTGEDLVKYNHSFMLKEVDGEEPQILYPEILNEPKGSEAARITQRDYAELTPEILKTFKTMRASGLESTLQVYSMAEQTALEEMHKTPEEEAFDRKQRAKRARIAAATSNGSAYRAKHLPLEPAYPQTPQQEKIMLAAAEFKQIQQRRLIVEAKRAQSSLSAWQRHQQQYSGD